MRNTRAQPVVLLMNDQAVETLALSEALEEANYKVAGPLVAMADALVWIEREQPDLAILGVLSADGSGEAIAEALQERGIPFLVHSADQPTGPITGAAGVPWLAKPAWPWDVVATLDELSLMAVGPRPACGSSR